MRVSVGVGVCVYTACPGDPHVQLML